MSRYLSSGFGSQYRTGFELFFLIRLDYERMFINLLVYLLISSYQLKSQTLYSVDKWMEYVEELALETEDTERIEVCMPIYLI